jgi:xylose dehydrogenase (NAD/NADP)
LNDRALRWGLLSTARINSSLIPAIRAAQRSKLCAVASRDHETALEFARQWDIPRAYGRYQELLADPDIDAVYIPLPNHLHEEWTIRAAEAGKHVLCEKPLALSVASVDAMSAAAWQNRVVLQEAFAYQFHPQTHNVRRLVQDGAIGQVRALRAEFSFLLSKTDDYRLDREMGGGALWDVGCYPVSLFRVVLDAEPLEASGWQWAGPTGVDLGFAGQLRFPQDVFAQFFCSLGSTSHREFSISGSQGRIRLDHPWLHNLGESATIFVDRSGDENSTLDFHDVQPYRCQVEGMAAAVLDEAGPTVSLAHSRGNVTTIEALLESARIGRSIVLR